MSWMELLAAAVFGRGGDGCSLTLGRVTVQTLDEPIHSHILNIIVDTPPVVWSMLTLNFPSYHETEITSEKERMQAKGKGVGWDR